MQAYFHPDKAKPTERWGRKATGLLQDSRIAWEKGELGFYFLARM